ncbi:MAG: hypothetical protein ACAI44_33430 [Candidatus Sericytochromatia bacterium]
MTHLIKPPRHGISEIRLETPIRAPLAACFDLARSVDAHLDSVSASGERAVAGRTAGLMELGDSVTWRARHLGIWQNLTVIITEMEPPHFFADEMLTGAFRYMRHEHRFNPADEGTLMQDRFLFASPCGPIGQLVNRLYLENYMRRFLCVRNAWLKQTLEAAAGNGPA